MLLLRLMVMCDDWLCRSVTVDAEVDVPSTGTGIATGSGMHRIHGFPSAGMRTGRGTGSRVSCRAIVCCGGPAPTTGIVSHGMQCLVSVLIVLVLLRLLRFVLLCVTVAICVVLWRKGSHRCCYCLSGTWRADEK